MSNNGFPEFFYKYTDAYGAKKILNELTLLFKSPLDFNDPFDSKIEFVPDLSNHKAIMKLMTDEKKEQWKQDYPTINWDQAQQDHINAAKPEDLYKFVTNAKKVQKISGYMKIFCMTTTYENLLMWSHYADEHQGAVIALDSADNLFEGAALVEYTNDRTVFNLASPMKDHESLNTLGKIIRQKSIHWSYEQEWRKVFEPLTEKDANIDPQIGYIPTTTVKAIYLGCKMPQHDRQEILHIIQTKLPHVKVYESKPEKNKFKLNFKEIRFTAKNTGDKHESNSL